MKENEEKNEIWNPIFNDEIEIHPAIDFKDICYCGVWIKSKLNNSENEVKDKLWFLTPHGLVSPEEEQILLKTEPLFLKINRISYYLLTKISSFTNFPSPKTISRVVDIVDNLTSIILRNFYLNKDTLHDTDLEHFAKFNSLLLTKNKHSNDQNQAENLKHFKHLKSIKRTNPFYNPLFLSLYGSIIKEHSLFLSKMRTVFSEVSNNRLQTLPYLQLFFKTIIFLIYRKFWYYIDQDDDSRLFLSLWTFGTYFFPLFRSYPYVYLNGTKRCGKTTVLEVTEKIAFNAMRTGSISASSIFRLIESVRPTLLIDEQDALVNARNQPILKNILLNGYKQGNRVFRSVQKGEKVDFTVKGYDTYCPKMIANITGLEDTLEDRTVPITMLRTKNRIYGDRSQEIDYDTDWQHIRDLCYISMLYLWKPISNFYNSFKNTTGTIMSRDWELWKPVLSLAWLCGEDVYERMVNFAKQKSEEKLVEDVNEQHDNNLVRALLDIVDSENGEWYQVKDILEAFKKYYEDEEKTELPSGEIKIKKIYPHWIKPTWLGRSMKRLHFKKKRTVAGKRQYFLTREEVEDLAERLGILESKETENIEEDIEEEKELKNKETKEKHEKNQEKTQSPEEPQESENPQEQPQDAKPPPSQAENNMIDEVIYNAHKKLEGEEEVPDWESITIEDMLRKNLNIQKHEEELFQQLVNTIEKARQKKRKGIEEKLAQIEKQAKEAEDKPQKESPESPEVEKEKPQTESKPQESPQKSGERLPSSPIEAPKIGFEPEESSGIPREVVIEKSGKVRKTKEIIDKILEILGWFNNETTIQSLNFELHAYENDYRIPDELFYKIIDWMIEKGLVYKPKPHLIRRSGY